MFWNRRHKKLLEKIEFLENQLRLMEAVHGKRFWLLMDRLEEQSLGSRQIACIVCGLEGGIGDFKTHVDECIFGGGKLTRMECPKCDCIFGPMKYLDLNDDFVSQDYALLYSGYSEGDSTANEVHAFRTLSPSLAPGKRYLNWGVGGAWNRTMQMLRGEGFDIRGYEPGIPHSSEFVARTKEEICGKFNGIFSNNVIEHFRKPVDEFLYFSELLEEGGPMVHQSPCYGYSHAFTRFHTLFLLGKSPHVLAERTGFTAVRVVPGKDTMSYLFKKA